MGRPAIEHRNFIPGADLVLCERAWTGLSAQKSIGIGSRSSRTFSSSLRRPPVTFYLIIDEVGYLQHANNAANVLYGVIDGRFHRKKPMIFTTNKPLREWGDVLHDRHLAEAILDRILEHGTHIELASIATSGSQLFHAGKDDWNHLPRHSPILGSRSWEDFSTATDPIQAFPAADLCPTLKSMVDQCARDLHRRHPR